MTRRNRANASNLFLLELILAILFFSIASAVCVQIFVKSHLLSQNARELNMSVTEVSNIAELINASDNSSSAVSLIQSEYPDSVISGESNIYIFYDKDFIPCKEKDAFYCLKADFTQEASMLTGDLDMTGLDNDESIYSLNISHHLQRRDANGI